MFGLNPAIDTEDAMDAHIERVNDVDGVEDEHIVRGSD